MVPPVPIPNTVVKHLEAESTCMETCWEDRKLPVKKKALKYLSAFFFIKIQFNNEVNVMNLFRKKDIAHLAQDAEKSGFVRNLTAFDLVFLGIGSVIGTGIFVLTGVGAALYAGPGIAISFILASVACAFAGLAFL